jgi:hypothetical protein
MLESRAEAEDDRGCTEDRRHALLRYTGQHLQVHLLRVEAHHRCRRLGAHDHRLAALVAGKALLELGVNALGILGCDTVEPSCLT